MSMDAIEGALIGRGAAARELCPTDAHVSAAVSTARRSGRRSVRPFLRGLPAPAIGLIALVLGGAGALATTQALHPDFGAFLDGGELPGRQLTPAETPTWIRDSPTGSQRDASVIASSGSHRLFAYRQSDGYVCFGFDHDYGECSAPGYYRRALEENPMVVLGPIYDQQGRSRTHGSLFGYVAGSIAKVRIDYPDGRSELAPARTGAFIVPIVLSAHPTALVGLGSDGEEVASFGLTRRGEVELKRP